MKEKLTRYGKPGAMLGGAMYIVAFVAAYLIYGMFAETTKNNFLGDHAFIHMIDTPMFVLLALGAVGVFLSQKEYLGKIGKVGFGMTLFGFVLGIVGGAAIIAVGLAISDAATMGILDMVAHFFSHILYAIGSLVFGFALWRKGTLPKLGAVLMAVGPIWLLAMFVGGFGEGGPFLLIAAPVAATGLGWLLLGHGLRATESSPAPKTAEPAHSPHG
ncbi:MAG: hypothetical protein M3494_06130 [Actinomycetota bacterium]|jgi:hypothetical protein|nr:hypothetical protein [Actinomycetota bacterium]